MSTSGAAQDEAFFAALAQPSIRSLQAYDPGHDLVALRRRFVAGAPVELGSNENPYGPSARALAAIQDASGAVARYPDPRGGELRQAIAGAHGIDAAQVLLGNGSHELLMQLGQAFAGPQAGVVASQYGFAVYALAAAAAGAGLSIAPALPRTDAMARGHDLRALQAAVGPATRLVYIANPNNPTGTWLSGAALEAFIGALPSQVLVVVDEAYAEYVDDPAWGSMIPHVARHPNLVVTRTFSKAHGLAGLRVGYAVGHAGLVAVMERLRESFNVNLLAQAAATAALDDQAHVRSVVERTIAQRSRLADALDARGLFVHPSQANFLLVEFGPRAGAVEAALLARGVVLRPMAGYGLPGCLRITLGTDRDNTRLLAALDGEAA